MVIKSIKEVVIHGKGQGHKFDMPTANQKLKNDDIKYSLSKRTTDKDIVNLRLKMWFKEFEDAISL